MTSRVPLQEWRTLLITEPECEQWRHLTGKWQDLDDKRLRRSRSEAQATLARLRSSDVVGTAQTSQRKFEATGSAANRFRSSYSIDFSHTLTAGPVAPSKTMNYESGRLRPPAMALQRFADAGCATRPRNKIYGDVDTKSHSCSDDAWGWRIVDDIDRTKRVSTAEPNNLGSFAPQKHSCGNRRPHPHVTKFCDSAARSRIALFGGSCSTKTRK
eukprot:TRINITY_DN27397_c0_g2_i1.p1 TRINITY_DN27397_c0_g2~~TRINITY_DN27397_c0_g2_i1.p1  ORF type:complete len:214 (+),score=27.34 TRINITY_DN27397_c0_g2_i1:165-806(+)